MKSIQTKFITLILSMIVLCSILIGGVGILKAQRFIEKNTTEYLKIICSDKASKLNYLLKSTKKSVDMISLTALEELYYPNYLSNKKYLESYNFQMKNYVSICLKNTDSVNAGYIRFNPEVTEAGAGFFFEKVGNDLIDKLTTDIKKIKETNKNAVDWYYNPIKNKHSMWLPPYVNLNNGVYMISYIVPLFKDDCEIGIVGMDIDFDEIIKEILRIHVFDSGFAYLKDENGKILYHPKYAIGEDFKYSKDYIEISRRLENGMYLVITAPKSEINQERNSLFAQIVFFTFFIAIIFVLLTSEISKSMIRPLKSLTNAAQEITDGNLNIEIDSQSEDEIGVLARSFKKTVKSLKQYIDYINCLAYRDSLTGIKNKAAYDLAITQLEDDIKAGIVENYAIAIFDANGLKKINDTLGHEYGNALIINSCRLICEIFNHSPVYRIGGDEFVAILKHSDFENRKSLQKLLEKAMEQKKENKNVCERVSIACGIAENQDDENIIEVFKRADALMYENKKIMKKSYS